MHKESDFSLLPFNTFGVEARCAHFWEYASVEDLQALISEMHQMPSLPILHIGLGSNLLFTKDFPGIVLHSAIRGVEVVHEDEEAVLVRAGAGENWDEFVAKCTASKYFGLENLAYIPGEVGASAVQNIGAYGAEAADFINEVEVVDLETGEFSALQQAQCRYAYRQSVFKNEYRGKYAVTHVTFKLSKTFKPNLSYAALQREMNERGLEMSNLTAEKLRLVVTEIRKSKLPEPAELGSAGSFFMNPVVSREIFEKIAQQYPIVPHYEVASGMKIPAGWLIDQCGWRGKNLGCAGVYEKQALVLVNRGGATGADIVALSEAVRSDVEAQFGILLKPEVNFI